MINKQQMTYMFSINMFTSQKITSDITEFSPFDLQYSPGSPNLCEKEEVHYVFNTYTQIYLKIIHNMLHFASYELSN